MTMQDSDIIDSDGFPVQEYTIHVASPIYPDASKSEHENAMIMMKENYRVWKDIYEKVYGEKLTYTCGMNLKIQNFIKNFLMIMKNYQNRLVNKKLRPVGYMPGGAFLY